MFHYQAYGLAITSEIPLLELDPAPLGSDVLIVYADNNDSLKEYRDQDYHVLTDTDRTCFWLKEAGMFVVRGGSRIEVTPNPGVDADLLRLYVQGMILAMLLHQRGFCVLHASVVCVDGITTAFVGHVGAGKSSLAAALYCLGHRILSDDNAAVYFDDGRPFVVPAYPHVKVFPAIAASLGYDQAKLRPLHSVQKKCAGSVTETFDHAPAALDQIFVLGREFDPDPKRLTPSAAIVEVLRNTVPTRWGHPGDGTHLSRCAKVVAAVPVFSIKTFDTLESLPRIAGNIERCIKERVGQLAATS